MKKLTGILILVLALFACIPAFAVNVGDPYKFVYVVQDSDRSFVTGLSPQVKIQRSSDGAWFDFSDSVFKSSGWVSQGEVLAEDATGGFYHYTFTPPGSETGPEIYQFVIDLDSLTYPDHQVMTVAYQDNARNKYVNGVKDSGDYEGIEKMIRVQR